MSCSDRSNRRSNVSLNRLVSEFQARPIDRQRDDRDHYRKRNCPSIHAAIQAAARAERNDGKRHSHQYRIKRTTIRRTEMTLPRYRTKIERSTSFDQLFQTITGILDPISGAGEMYIYDTAFRIGIYLGLPPRKVYLHRGTRTGAKKLGLPVDRDALHMQELRRELRGLAPADVEDFLCMNKDSF